jgi:hypothetical protein
MFQKSFENVLKKSEHILTKLFFIKKVKLPVFSTLKISILTQ